MRTLSDLTGFQNIGYKYFDKDDFTYLSQLSMGMLDNIFVSGPIYQKIQDVKIDYSHPKPIWPFSNHLPLMIDIDTTWYGGWGSPKGKPPQFKSIHPNKYTGDQYRNSKIPNKKDFNTGYGYTPYDLHGYHNYGYETYGGQIDSDHNKGYKRDDVLKEIYLHPEKTIVSIPAQDHMPEPPVPAAKVVNMNDMLDGYEYYDDEYEYDDALGDYDYGYYDDAEEYYYDDYDDMDDDEYYYDDYEDEEEVDDAMEEYDDDYVNEYYDEGYGDYYDGEGYEMKDDGGYENEDEYYYDNMNIHHLNIDYSRFRREHDMKDGKYEVIGEDDIVATETWLSKVIKYMIYSVVAIVCCCCGIGIGYISVELWRGYKGRAVHLNRFY